MAAHPKIVDAWRMLMALCGWSGFAQVVCAQRHHPCSTLQRSVHEGMRLVSLDVGWICMHVWQLTSDTRE